jgi:hypothetical protein
LWYGCRNQAGPIFLDKGRYIRAILSPWRSRRISNMNILIESRLVTIARWGARILSVLLLWLAVVSVVDHLHGDCAGHPMAENVAGRAASWHLRETVLGACLFTVLAGLIAGWKWEGLGGLLIVGGYAVFAMVNGPRTLVPNPWANPLFASLIVGLLFLFCWWRTRRRLSA